MTPREEFHHELSYIVEVAYIVEKVRLKFGEDHEHTQKTFDVLREICTDFELEWAPKDTPKEDEKIGISEKHGDFVGISRRDYFAAQDLNGLLSHHGDTYPTNRVNACIEAIEYADLLIQELDKTPPKNDE